MGPAPRPAIDRFMEKIDNTNGCWLWTAALFSNGYGAFRDGPRQRRAHRWAYEHFNGPIPEGAVVMHTCDVKRCVNPDHLLAGTQQDNQRDMVRKKRCATGVRAHAVLRPQRLSQELADEIRMRYAAGDVTQTALASEYNVSQTMIGLITRGLRWNPASYVVQEPSAVSRIANG